MRRYPKDNDEKKESEKLEAPTWMLEQLKLNPSYVYWGPHEDYMWKEKGGWDSRVIVNSWGENSFELDELNEVVNFYFEVNRPHEDCSTCNGKSYHPDAQWISESWYKNDSPFTKSTQQEEASKEILRQFGCQFKPSVHGRGSLPPEETIVKYGKSFLGHCVETIDNGGEWYNNLTQDEVDALWKGNRLRLEFKKKPTAAQVNSWARGRGLSHDAINRWICIEQRCQRLGVPLYCPTCEGKGYRYTGPAYLSLILWVLHPRKGCSRGVEINHIQQDELPKVYEYLREAADRNANRFSKIPTEALA